MKKIVSAVSVLALACTLSAVPSAHASTDWRGKLGKGCSWSQKTGGYYFQHCSVYSPSMNRRLPVDVKRGSSRNAPVVIMLDGARGSHNMSDWITLGHIQPHVVNKDATFVFPAGGKASFYADWDKQGTTPYLYRWETFITRELPRFLRSSYGVIPGNWSVAGISMGAHSAVRLAAQHPQLFTTAFGFSGVYNMGYYGAHAMIKDVYPGTTADHMYGPKNDPRWVNFNIGAQQGAGQLKNKYLRRIILTSADTTPNSDNYMGVYLEALAHDDTQSTVKLYRSMGIPVSHHGVGSGLHVWNTFAKGFIIAFPKHYRELPRTAVDPLPKPHKKKATKNKKVKNKTPRKKAPRSTQHRSHTSR